MANSCVEKSEDLGEGVPVDGDPSTRVVLKIVDRKYVVGRPPKPKDTTGVESLTDDVEDACSKALETED